MPASAPGEPTSPWSTLLAADEACRQAVRRADDLRVQQKAASQAVKKVVKKAAPED